MTNKWNLSYYTFSLLFILNLPKEIDVWQTPGPKCSWPNPQMRRNATA